MNTNDARQAMTELPELETKCSRCSGRGYSQDFEGDDKTDCLACGGGGYIPTQIGARILELVRHNSRLKVSAELRVAGVTS